MDSPPEEYALACRARQGDSAALEELVERARGRLFALAYAELRDYHDAQDAVGSALARICTAICALREPARVRQWMQSVVRNEARMLRRGRRVTARLESAGLISAEDTQEAHALRMDVQRALISLPRDHAHAIALFYLAGMSINEIAERVGRPQGTVKRWLHEGRHQLASIMEDYGPMEQKPERTAAVIGDKLSPELARTLEVALRRAGYARVFSLSALPALAWAGKGGSLEYHLPEPLGAADLIILDEWIGGRSAFEAYVILRATAEGKTAAICQLLDTPADVTVFAAWAAGCDLCFNKSTLDAEEFERLVRKHYATGEPDATSGTE